MVYAIGGGVIVLIGVLIYAAYIIKANAMLKYSLKAVEERDKIEEKARKEHETIDARVRDDRSRVVQWLRSRRNGKSFPSDEPVP